MFRIGLLEADGEVITGGVPSFEPTVGKGGSACFGLKGYARTIDGDLGVEVAAEGELELQR